MRATPDGRGATDGWQDRAGVRSSLAAVRTVNCRTQYSTRFRSEVARARLVLIRGNELQQIGVCQVNGCAADKAQKNFVAHWRKVADFQAVIPARVLEENGKLRFGETELRLGVGAVLQFLVGDSILPFEGCEVSKQRFNRLALRG